VDNKIPIQLLPDIPNGVFARFFVLKIGGFGLT